MNKKSIGYAINHEEKTITITKLFEEHSLDRNTAEYRELRQLREEYPDYRIQRRTARAGAGKNAFKGLNLEKMVGIIEKNDGDGARMKEFKEELKSGGFAHTRAWFIKKYEADLPKPKEAAKKLTVKSLLA